MYSSEIFISGTNRIQTQIGKKIMPRGAEDVDKERYRKEEEERRREHDRRCQTHITYLLHELDPPYYDECKNDPRVREMKEYLRRDKLTYETHTSNNTHFSNGVTGTGGCSYKSGDWTDKLGLIFHISNFLAFFTGAFSLVCFLVNGLFQGFTTPLLILVILCCLYFGGTSLLDEGLETCLFLIFLILISGGGAFLLAYTGSFSLALVIGFYGFVAIFVSAKLSL